jgi:two-component system copper resistance phosphate regulon response regulator CusR
MRVLLIEDDRAIGSFIARTLREAGYVVDLVGTAKDAEQTSIDQEHSIVILDLGLPDREGLDLLVSLRAQGLTAPVLILSAKRSVDDRVRGLETGGDDYLTKPFAVAELLARMRNLSKRNLQKNTSAVKLRALDLELDLLRREATRGSRNLRLTTQEFALLEYLCRNAGRVVTRSMILDQVWKMRIDPETNVVDVHIYRLRSKVDGENEVPLIRTLRGVGYVLKDR